jgi:kynureninase
MPNITNLEYAIELDQKDKLADFRNEFVIDDPELIYLDGNSLGRLPKKTKARLKNVIENEWGQDLIRSWNKSWFNLPERVGEKIARLIGADPDEVIIADSTSVNLFKLAFAAVRAQPNRKIIITDNLNFPSDIYILKSILKFFGSEFELKIINSPDGISIPIELIGSEIDDHTALVSLSHTAYKSGFVYPMKEITQLAHNVGAFILWDVSHSVGAVPFSLNEADVDFAVGCTYKYLNSGPGSPAFLYVKKDLQNKLENPISGWFSQRNQFDFDLDFLPDDSIKRFLTGIPPILSLAAIENGVDLILKAEIERLREKSVRQSEYFIELFDVILSPLGFRLNSPRTPTQRGSHISIGHNEGYRINYALIDKMNIIPDFRVPDNIRFGIAPLYTSFVDIYTTIQRLQQIVNKKLYEKYSLERSSVT